VHAVVLWLVLKRYTHTLSNFGRRVRFCSFNNRDLSPPPTVSCTTRRPFVSSLWLSAGPQKLHSDGISVEDYGLALHNRGDDGLIFWDDGSFSHGPEVRESVPRTTPNQLLFMAIHLGGLALGLALALSCLFFASHTHTPLLLGGSLFAHAPSLCLSNNFQLAQVWPLTPASSNSSSTSEVTVCLTSKDGRSRGRLWQQFSSSASGLQLSVSKTSFTHQSSGGYVCRRPAVHRMTYRKWL